MTLPVPRFSLCNPQPLSSRSRRTSTLESRGTRRIFIASTSSAHRSLGRYRVGAALNELRQFSDAKM
jgi:hypothetical protein